MNPGAPCQSCHMPPDPTVKNSADLQLFEGATVGISGGWVRPPGSVRQHSWVGPRAEDGRMLENAAALFVEVSITTDETSVSVTTKNVGPGHAIPTGEPLRSLVLVVDARCDGVSVPATGGDAVSDIGGALALKTATEDWTSWPAAQPGDVVRVVAYPGGYHDYQGYGPFGDGTFDAAAKGWRKEEVVGTVTVTSVTDAGIAAFDGPIPNGDVAYLTRASTDYAGRAGVAFARVLSDANGVRMVPHYAAVDVVSDNRLLPQQAWTSVHIFPTQCEQPEVTARLWHLDVPAGLARSKGWKRTARQMTEVTR